MRYKIGVVWSSRIDNKEDILSDDIVLYDNIRMSEAGELVKKLLLENTDAIVVTAGIEAEIKNTATIPMVVGYPTYMDVLETLRHIENDLGIVNKKIALVLQETNPFSVERLRPFSKNRISLYKFKKEEDIDSLVCMLVEKGFYGMIAGPTAAARGDEMGLRTYPLAFESRIVVDAIEKARRMIEFSQKEQSLIQQLSAVINIYPDGIIVTDEAGCIEVCNPKATDILRTTERELMGQSIRQVIGDSRWRDVYKSDAMQTDILMEYKGNRFFTTIKPIVINDVTEGLVVTIQEASKIQNLESHYRSVQSLGLVAKYRFRDIIYRSGVMERLIAEARAYSRFDLTVLIYGETGTGKEMFAQSIHNESLRSSGPFVAINCAALTESLLESELMGYEEGAFTGAKKGGKAGLFERAHKGTIFLDEINQISVPLQLKLLRVIQERTVRRIGGDRIIPVDVRIIAATNEDLAEKIRHGEFRNDLYYRLNVLSLSIPPLRERRDDIPCLVEWFLSGFREKYGDTPLNAEDIVKSSVGYDWWGNIRELENYVVRYAALSQGEAPTDMHPDDRGAARREESARMSSAGNIAVSQGKLSEMERQLIAAVVTMCEGNKTKAAQMLGISRNTIASRLNEG